MNFSGCPLSKGLIPQLQKEPIVMKALLMLSLMFVLPTAHAIEAESCEVWQQKANTFMTYRQQGLPIAQAMQEAAGNKTRGLLLRAYAEPVENGLEAQYEVIGSFSETVFNECQAGLAAADTDKP